jgi:hypothetical protein
VAADGHAATRLDVCGAVAAHHDALRAVHALLSAGGSRDEKYEDGGENEEQRERPTVHG